MSGSFSSLECNLIGLHGNMLNDLIRGDSLTFEHDIIKLTMPFDFHQPIRKRQSSSSSSLDKYIFGLFVKTKFRLTAHQVQGRGNREPLCRQIGIQVHRFFHLSNAGNHEFCLPNFFGKYEIKFDSWRLNEFSKITTYLKQKENIFIKNWCIDSDYWGDD